MRPSAAKNAKRRLGLPISLIVYHNLRRMSSSNSSSAGLCLQSKGWVFAHCMSREGSSRGSAATNGVFPVLNLKSVSSVDKYVLDVDRKARVEKAKERFHHLLVICQELDDSAHESDYSAFLQLARDSAVLYR